MSKLYTEEQVRKAIKLSLINAKLFIHKWLGKDDKYFPTVDEGINTITPIELPSIKKIAGKIAWENIDAKKYEDQYDAFIGGAEWYEKQILNQNI